MTREQRARAMGSSRLALVLEAGRRHGAPVYTFGCGVSQPRVIRDTEREARRAQALADPANYRRYLLDAEDLEWWQTEGRRRARR